MKFIPISNTTFVVFITATHAITSTNSNFKAGNIAK